MINVALLRQGIVWSDSVRHPSHSIPEIKIFTNNRPKKLRTTAIIHLDYLPQS